MVTPGSSNRQIWKVHAAHLEYGSPGVTTEVTRRCRQGDVESSV